jgi:hypothetical protein
MFSFDHRSLPPTFGFLSLFFALPQSYLNRGEELGRGNSLVLEGKKGRYATEMRSGFCHYHIPGNKKALPN